MNATLVREKLQVADDTDKDFYNECHRKLGYKAEVLIPGVPTKLASALDAIGCVPLKRSTVDEYQRRCQWRQPMMVSCLVTVAVALIAAIGFGVAALVLWNSDWTVGIAATLLVAIPTAMFFLFKACIWEVTPIAHYRQAVPDFALQTALDLKAKLPEVELFIESFEKRKVHDPFLVAVYGGKWYYLEVWNEPGFKQQREV